MNVRAARSHRTCLSAVYRGDKHRDRRYFAADRSKPPPPKSEPQSSSSAAAGEGQRALSDTAPAVESSEIGSKFYGGGIGAAVAIPANRVTLCRSLRKNYQNTQPQEKSHSHIEKLATVTSVVVHLNGTTRRRPEWASGCNGLFFGGPRHHT